MKGGREKGDRERKKEWKLGEMKEGRERVKKGKVGREGREERGRGGGCV